MPVEAVTHFDTASWTATADAPGLAWADPERVRPVDSSRHPRPAPRPAYSALSPQRSADAGLTPLRPWREAVAAAMAVTL